MARKSVARRSVSGRVQLELAGEPAEFRYEVPAGRIGVRRALPVLHAFVDFVADRIATASAADGKPASCRSGCAACCRQMPTVSPTEAHALRLRVASMDADKRARVEARFAAAQVSLEAAEVWSLLLEPESLDRNAIAYAIQGLALACPFLEDERCSIYAERPTVCREYAVVSPPEHCADPASGKIERLTGAGDATAAVESLDAERYGTGWVPLVAALVWAAAHPEKPPTEKGAALFDRFFGAL